MCRKNHERTSEGGELMKLDFSLDNLLDDLASKYGESNIKADIYIHQNDANPRSLKEGRKIAEEIAKLTHKEIDGPVYCDTTAWWWVGFRSNVKFSIEFQKSESFRA